MRRLISMLAAGLLAGGTVLTAAGAASASPTAARQATCTSGGNFFATAGSVNYYLGTPNKLSSGAAAILKPSFNATTSWTICDPFQTSVIVLENRGLALTSRASSPGADVTLTPPGNGGNGFTSQQWYEILTGPDFDLFENVKTTLFLRVRNSGPVMGQTVTTGSTFTSRDS